MRTHTHTLIPPQPTNPLPQTAAALSVDQASLAEVESTLPFVKLQVVAAQGGEIEHLDAIGSERMCTAGIQATLTPDKVCVCCGLWVDGKVIRASSV
jgi:hypothetical protein